MASVQDGNIDINMSGALNSTSQNDESQYSLFLDGASEILDIDSSDGENITSELRTRQGDNFPSLDDLLNKSEESNAEASINASAERTIVDNHSERSMSPIAWSDALDESPYHPRVRTGESTLLPPSTGLARNATGDPTDCRDLCDMRLFHGRRVSKKGMVLDHNGEALGELAIGNIEECAGAKINGQGEVCSRDGHILGRVRVILGDAAAAALQEFMDKLEEDEETEREIQELLPEVEISKNAILCAHLAARQDATPPQTYLSFQGQDVQDFEFAKLARKMDNMLDTLKSIKNDLPSHMHPQLYTKLPLREFTAEYNEMLAAIAKQHTWKHGIPPGAQKRHAIRTSVEMPKPEVIIVDTKEAVADMVSDILAAIDPHAEYHMSLGFEGKNLIRDGDVSFAKIYIPSTNQLYILDISTLGTAAFSCPVTGKDSMTDFRAILENPTIVKLMFDCRHESIVLHNIFGINLEEVIDVQLLFCATRTAPRDRRSLTGLSKAAPHAVDLDSETRKAWKHSRRWGQVCLALGESDALDAHKVCLEDAGEWTKISNMVKLTIKEHGLKECDVRPFPEMIKQYCIADTVLLAAVREYCLNHPVWNEDWEWRVKEATRERLGMREWKEIPVEDGWWAMAPRDWARVEHVFKEQQSDEEG